MRLRHSSPLFIARSFLIVLQPVLSWYSSPIFPSRTRVFTYLALFLCPYKPHVPYISVFDSLLYSPRPLLFGIILGYLILYLVTLCGVFPLAICDVLLSVCSWLPMSQIRAAEFSINDLNYNRTVANRS